MVNFSFNISSEGSGIGCYYEYDSTPLKQDFDSYICFNKLVGDKINGIYIDKDAYVLG